MKQITRNFNIADADLLHYARVMQSFYVQDLPLFSGFDHNLSVQQSNDLSQWVSDVILSTDESTRAELVGHTEELKQQMEVCTTLFKKVRYFARRAFANKPVTLLKFGVSRFAAIKRSQVKFAQFMENIATVVNQYRSHLVSAGAPNPFLDDFIAATNLLITLNKTQDEFKFIRIDRTATRIEKLNAIWAFLQRIEEVAGFLFIQNFAKRRPYILPRRRFKKQGSPQIFVPRSSKVQVLDDKIVSPITYEVKNTGKERLGFFLTEQLGNALPETLTWVSAGESITLTLDALPNGAPAVWVVLNQSMNHEGSFELKPIHH